MRLGRVRTVPSLTSLEFLLVMLETGLLRIGQYLRMHQPQPGRTGFLGATNKDIIRQELRIRQIIWILDRRQAAGLAKFSSQALHPPNIDNP